MKKLDNFGIDQKLTSMPSDVAERIASLSPEQIAAIRQEFDYGGFAKLAPEEARQMARFVGYLYYASTNEAA